MNTRGKVSKHACTYLLQDPVRTGSSHGCDLLLLGSAQQLDHALVLLVGVLHLVLYQGSAAGVGHRFDEDLTLLDLPCFLGFNAPDLVGDVLQ